MKRMMFQLWFLMGLLIGAFGEAQAQNTWDPESPREPGQLSVTLVSLPAGGANFSQTHTDGRYEPNEAVTVRVTPYSDYDFVAWLDENGNEVSQQAEYAFTVTKNRKLTALLAFNPKD